ncbi:alpha/beta fold hydrolase [Telmatocola sphagniphila]|uniref:Alpha/beta fold hydrolase n=1 Tax=Telmatocola sphagniphila TaxID=1123043 RepID=A0A8E6EZD4_9BACT|nr:PHB depolymerase family esterase [Telmatocola sphagniphila]QVL33356.1 alpha/beta fold hydrolase [Telmatocola sphagniphila]
MRQIIRKNVDGLERQAIFYQHNPGNSRQPLLIVLHGKGGTADWVLEETQLEMFASEQGIALLAPDALTLEPDKPPKFLSNPQFWNSDPRNEFAGRLPDDVRFLKILIDDFRQYFLIDPKRIYVTGFSNGAAMTFRLAIEAGQVLAGIAPIAGNCLVDPVLLHHPVPTLWLMGEKDPLMPFEGGLVTSPWGKQYTRPPMVSEAQRWASALKFRLEEKHDFSYPDREGMRYVREGQVYFEFCKLKNLGHHWPGGLGRLNPKLFGPAAPINGNELIWNFFKHHQLG